MGKSKEKVKSITKCIAKNYKKAIYNQDVYGEYRLNELCNIHISHENESELLVLFKKGIESIEHYPFMKEDDKKVVKELIEKKYINENSHSVNELSKEYNIPVSSTYVLINDGLMIVGEYMYKEGGELIEKIE